jgi:hypothetical protein
MTHTNHKKRGHSREKSKTTKNKFLPPEGVAHAIQNAQRLLHANNFLNKKY